MKENARHEHYIGFKGRKMNATNTMDANMKLYVQDRTSFYYLMYIRQVNFSVQSYTAYTIF